MTYSIAYRTGGTHNFRWHMVLNAFSTAADAVDRANEIERMGYPCYIYKQHELEAIGLPETYEA